MRKKYTHPSFEGSIELSYHKEVCSECNGEGKTFRSDLDQTKLMEIMEEDGDDEGLDDIRNGQYDQICRTCNGLRVVDVADWQKATEEYPEQIKAVFEWDKQEAEDAKYAAQERMVGA
jgi:DnaJ-class molecular chaperone